MLLKILFFVFALTSAFARGDFKIVEQNGTYLLKNDQDEFPLSYSDKPVLIDISVDRGLSLIEYFSGDFGTSKIMRINNLIVLKKGKVLIDAPFKYLNEKIQPVWDIDHEKKIIDIKDPMGTNQKVYFK